MNPKGITQNLKVPCGVVNAVIGMDVRCIRICQYPAAKSNVLKYHKSPSWSKCLWICGSPVESVN